MQQFQVDNVATGDTFALSAIEKEGQAWFVAADVCTALGLKNSRQSLASLDDDEKGVCITDTPGGRQQVATVNESGLYTLIFRSRKEGAKRFKKWITAVVIPSIRQHGGYINGQEALPQEDQAATLQAVQEEAARVRARNVEERDARRSGFAALRGGPSYDKYGKRIR